MLALCQHMTDCFFSGDRPHPLETVAPRPL